MHTTDKGGIMKTINLDDFGMHNEIHLCSTCESNRCECRPDNIIYGTGVVPGSAANCNVAACNLYRCKPPSAHLKSGMKIEQIAFAANDPQTLMGNLGELGLYDWSHDTVEATGTVFGTKVSNVAELHFNYQLGFELEILKYQSGSNWHQSRNEIGDPVFLSHIGMHASKEEINSMKQKFAEVGISIAQELYTTSHNNPAIKGKRKYHYVVFDSKDAFGFDLKLIERIMI